jgi:hypothetical protein
MSDLGTKFDKAMFEVYRRAKDEAGYKATIFLRMLNDHGGLQTAKSLINARKPSDGYTALYLLGRLDLTVEALVLEDAGWHPLFSNDELQLARKRLKEYRYDPRESRNTHR